MPAIRFRNNGILSIATAPPTNNSYVEIRMHNGQIQRFEWLGFICRPGLQMLPDGGFAKMLAVLVTNGCGVSSDEWVKVQPDQYVVAWRVLLTRNGNSAWGIYTLIDNAGWPIVMTDKNYKDPRLQTAEVFQFGKTTRKASEKNSKIN